MSDYRHLLVALELEDASHTVLAKAHALARAFEAKLSVVHVLEAIAVQPMSTSATLDTALLPPVDLSEPMAEQARRRMAPWLAELGIAADAFEVVFDSVRAGIVDHAERIGADLIVVGRHTHRGLSSLFSHTEAGVQSRAKCDVLAVVLADAA